MLNSGASHLLLFPVISLLDLPFTEFILRLRGFTKFKPNEVQVRKRRVHLEKTTVPSASTAVVPVLVHETEDQRARCVKGADRKSIGSRSRRGRANLFNIVSRSRSGPRDKCDFVTDLQPFCLAFASRNQSIIVTWCTRTRIT